MQKTLNQLADWLQMTVNSTPAEYDFFKSGKSFYLYEQETDEPFAVCTIDSADRLIGLDYIDPDQFESSNLKPSDIPTITEAFIREFHPDGLDTYRLQAVIDLDDLYMVEYGLQDEKYGLDLPGIGFSLVLTTDGRIVQFSFDEGPADIRYPEQLLPEEEAESAYADHMDFELEIHKTDTEIFRNGDNIYQLVWSLKEAAVDIPADGSEPDSVTEEKEYETLPEPSPFPLSLHSRIGLTEQHVKINEQSADGLQIEKWQHASLKTLEDIDLSEAYASTMVTIHYDSAGCPVFVYNGEAWADEETELEEEFLKQYAVDFVHSLFPDAQDQFMLEKLEEDTCWDEFEEELDESDESEEEIDLDEDEAEWVDEPDEAEEELAKDFYFQRFLNSVPIADQTMVVSVGIYSGRIITASLESIEELPPTVLTTPVLTKQQAVDQLMQQLKMELAMTMEFDEDGKSFYRLAYLPSFPATTGHVRMIDAENGKAYFVDVGGSIFY